MFLTSNVKKIIQFKLKNLSPHLKMQTLIRKFHSVDIKEYDHNNLTFVIKEISILPPKVQNNVIHSATRQSLTFHQLMEYIRQQFYILHQEDDEGPYSALVFGNTCISIGTWDGHEKSLSDLDEMYYTDVWNEDGESLRVEHLLVIIEFWIDFYETTLEDFFSSLEVIEM